MNNNPKGNNQYNKKSKKVTAVVITLFAVLALMVAGVFHGETILAQVDELRNLQDAKYVSVTASVNPTSTPMTLEEIGKAITQELDAAMEAHIEALDAYDDHYEDKVTPTLEESERLWRVASSTNDALNKATQALNTFRERL